MSQTTETAKRIEKFYSGTDQWLERLWSANTRMIHFGFFPDDEGRSISHDDSLIETVRQAARRLDLEPGMHVLDAGCGIGGPAIWVAQNYKVTVHGITNLQLHAAKATDLAREKHAEAVAQFSVQDYTKTGFADNTFDAMLAIESACYAIEKLDFLQEMYRVLKPGGRLSVLDAFRTRRNISPNEEKLMQSWLSGWGAAEIDTIDEFTNKAITAGFTDGKFEDLQTHFRPSHYRCYQSARWLTPILAALNKIGLVSDDTYGYCRAGRDAFIAAERRICLQGIFSARKP